MLAYDMQVPPAALLEDPVFLDLLWEVREDHRKEQERKDRETALKARHGR